MLNKALIKENFSGDEDILIDLIEQFIERKNDLIGRISAAISLQDPKELKISAHTLKGVVANFYAEEIKQKCYQLETMGHMKDLTFAEAVYLELKSMLDLFFEEIHELALELKE